MYIDVIGLNHKTVSLSIREQFALSTRELNEAYALLYKSSLKGSVILNTCN